MATARRTGTNENISTYGSTGMGRDYTVLATWEAATDVNLITAMTSEVLECYDDAVFDDAVTIAGASANSTYFRIIRPAPGQGHDGTPNTGIRFVSTAVTFGFLLSEPFVQCQDLTVTKTVNAAGNVGAFYINRAGAACVGCIAVNCTNAGAGSCWGFITGNTGVAILIDCIAINNDNHGFILSDVSNGDPIAYNCTSVNNGEDGFNVGGSVPTAINCLGSGNATADFSGTFAAASTNNASSDTTAPGTSPRISQTFTFVDAGSDDYHLTTNDTGALGFGLDLSADATFPFDDDIDGDTIVVWSIGFDSDPVAAVGPTPGHTYQYQGKDLGRIGFTRSWSN